MSKYRLYEDGYDEPVWLQFTKTLVAYNRKQLSQIRVKFRIFEEQHPLLTFVHTEPHVQTKRVFDKNPLFSDGNSTYYESRYSYPIHIITCYYTPHDDLLEFLERLQDFIDKRKRRCSFNFL